MKSSRSSVPGSSSETGNGVEGVPSARPDQTEIRQERVEGGSHRSGFVAVLGRPNVGKSTFINTVIGRRLAAVTPRPQTTRRRLLAIHTLPDAQILLLDTPGLHRARDLLNKRLVEVARQCAREADVLLWVIDAERGIADEDRDVAGLIRETGAACVVMLNKIDRISKPQLLPLMEEASKLLPEAEILPACARTGEGVPEIIEAIVRRLPEGPRYYPAEQLTDETERSIVAEIVREKVILHTRQEVPYAVAVSVDSFQEKPERRLVVIQATIHVDRPTQKPIVIGRGGELIKAIGKDARLEIERFLGCRVYLELFVRVQEGWTRQAARLREFGL